MSLVKVKLSLDLPVYLQCALFGAIEFHLEEFLLSSCILLSNVQMIWSFNPSKNRVILFPIPNFQFTKVVLRFAHPYLQFKFSNSALSIQVV